MRKMLFNNFQTIFSLVNGKVIYGEYIAVEYNKMRKRSGRWSFNGMLSMGIKLSEEYSK